MKDQPWAWVILALLLPASILASLGALTLELALFPAWALLMVPSAIAIAFLILAYTTTARILSTRHPRLQWVIRAHVVLHAVPFAYLASSLLAVPAAWVEALWLVPLAIFFFTGRRAWAWLFDLFRSKLYFIFYRGNTGVLVMMPVLLVAGILFDAALFSRVLTIYFVIHFMLLGISVLKIANDIENHPS